MRIEFCGVRGGAATPDADKIRYGGNTSSLIVTSADNPDHLFALDAGTGLARFGSDQLSINKSYTAAVLLSHLHLYHIIGFQFTPLAFSSLCKTEVIGPSTANFALESVFDNIMTPSFSPVYGLKNLMAQVAFTEVSESTRHIHGVEVQSMSFPHNFDTDSWGYRLSMQGRSMVYLTGVQVRTQDGMLDIGAVELAQDADVLIVGTFDPQHAVANRITYADTMEVAQRAGVQQVYFMHHHPNADDAHLDTVQEQVRADYPNLDVTLAQEGMVIDM